MKIAHRLGEEGKVSIRTIRQDFKKKIDSAKNEKTLSEDEAKSSEIELQKQIDLAIKDVETFLKVKEEDIMRV